MMRNSERGSFKRCPSRWWWGYREGLKSKEKAKPLWFGEGIHLALAHHYKGPGLKRGRNPMKVWRDYVGEEMVKLRVGGEDAMPEEWVEARTLGEAMLSGYFEKYGKDEHMFVIGPEYTFELQVPTIDRDGTLLVMTGTYDLVWRDLRDARERAVLEEHKTAKAIFTNHLPLDPQAGTYVATATAQLRSKDILGKHEELYGVEYNFLRKALPDQRPRNAQGLYLNKDGVTVSKNQPAPLFVREMVMRTRAERISQVHHIQNDFTHMQAFKDGVLELTKNPTRDCSWDCEFYHMCLLQEQGADWEEFRDHMFRVQDPYLDHRPKSTETGD